MSPRDDDHATDSTRCPPEARDTEPAPPPATTTLPPPVAMPPRPTPSSRLNTRPSSPRALRLEELRRALEEQGAPDEHDTDEHEAHLRRAIADSEPPTTRREGES